MLFAACGNSTPASNEAATTDAAPAAAQSEEAAPQPETLSDKTLTVVLQTEPTALASGYETIDELHYRFTLRDDVCYSDGTPVKAQDVVYSFTKYAEAGVAKASSSDEATSAEGFNGIVDYVFNNFCLRGLCTESKYCVVRRGIQGLSASSRMGYLDVGNAYEAD